MSTARRLYEDCSDESLMSAARFSAASVGAAKAKLKEAEARVKELTDHRARIVGELMFRIGSFDQ